MKNATKFSLIALVATGLAITIYQTANAKCWKNQFGWKECNFEKPEGTPIEPIKEFDIGLKLCMSIAHEVRSTNQRTSKRLTPTEKLYLRPYFGNLVDRVSLYYNAQLPSGYKIAGKTMAVDSSAQTWGHTVYFKKSQGNPNDPRHIIDLAHELVHAKQYESQGGLKKFCQKYAYGYTGEGRWNYYDNPMEREAFNLDFKVAQDLGRTYGQEQSYTHGLANAPRYTNTRTTWIPKYLTGGIGCGIAGCNSNADRKGSQLHSIKSYNYAGRYVRHQNFIGKLTQIHSKLDKQDATFKIVPGLAGRCSSLESVNYPGNYLRHQNWQVKLQSNDGSSLFTEDATFCLKKGLASSNHYSFESFNYPGNFIRHKNWHLYVESGNDDLFRKDATFHLVSPL